ncbi:hypothetical protein IHE45_17G112900 [Dioscorea alata]|nr:hypothetical protein IHE45_17G112900 [Dioscorea alata]
MDLDDFSGGFLFKRIQVPLNPQLSRAFLNVFFFTDLDLCFGYLLMFIG